jgi:hypothetical protein
MLVALNGPASAERFQNHRQFEIGFESALVRPAQRWSWCGDPVRMLRRAPALGEALAAWIIDGTADGPFADAAGTQGAIGEEAEDSVPRSLSASLLDEMPQRAVAS